MKIETETPAYQQLELAFSRWAASQPDVRAIVVFGSRANTIHLVSEWSDLDLMIMIDQPAEWIAKTDWLASIGEVQFTARETFIRDDWIPLVVLFAGMQKVDIVFTIIPIRCQPFDDLSRILAASPYPYVFSNGIKVLYDRNPSNTSLSLSPDLNYSVRLPTPEEYNNDVNLFWARAIHTATLIRRGEWWRACIQLQVELKGSLLTFLERQARLHYGSEHKIWPRGCYLDNWADPRAIAELPGCFTINLPSEPWDALRAICNLFHWLAVDIAERLGYIYPEACEIHSREWITYAHTSCLL